MIVDQILQQEIDESKNGLNEKMMIVLTNEILKKGLNWLIGLLKIWKIPMYKYVNLWDQGCVK